METDWESESWGDAWHYSPAAGVHNAEEWEHGLDHQPHDTEAPLFEVVGVVYYDPATDQLSSADHEALVDADISDELLMERIDTELQQWTYGRELMARGIGYRAVEACPIRSLSPHHYLLDGSCRCGSEP